MSRSDDEDGYERMRIQTPEPDLITMKIVRDENGNPLQTANGYWQVQDWGFEGNQEPEKLNNMLNIYKVPIVVMNSFPIRKFKTQTYKGQNFARSKMCICGTKCSANHILVERTYTCREVICKQLDKFVCTEQFKM